VLTCDRWRNWRSASDGCANTAAREPSKPTKPSSEGFAGSYAGEGLSSYPTFPDPAEWWEDFNQWMEQNCVRRRGREDWTRLDRLLMDFADWCLALAAMPCDLATFGRLLAKTGFTTSGKMVNGLVLKRDLEQTASSSSAIRDTSDGTEFDLSYWSNEAGPVWKSDKSLLLTA